VLLKLETSGKISSVNKMAAAAKENTPPNICPPASIPSKPKKNSATRTPGPPKTPTPTSKSAPKNLTKQVLQEKNGNLEDENARLKGIIFLGAFIHVKTYHRY
jgi:hypothetical protein